MLNNKLYLSCSYALMLSILLRFDYLFAGANRFIPFRIVILLSLFFLLFNFLNLKSVSISKSSIYFVLAFLGYFVSVHIFWFKYDLTFGAFLRNIFHFVYVLSGFFLTKYLVSRITEDQFQNLLKFTIFSVILIVGLETVFRFAFPTLDLNSEDLDYILNIYSGSQDGLSFDTFYFFKMSSIMFFDSNYVGAFLIIFLIINSKVVYYSKSAMLSSYIFIYLLIFLTLSRAALLTSIIVLIYLVMRKFSMQNFVAIIVFSVLFLVVFLFLYHEDLKLTDGSFLTKLEVFSSVINMFYQDVFIGLFGLGYEVGGYLYSYKLGGYAHVHLAILLGEIGLIGLIVYLSYWFWIYRYIGPSVLYVFLPFVIIGSSLADPWEIGYFVSCGLLSRQNDY